ncbi:MAG: hypothetical protein ACI9CQ_004596, partial [Saprospiraceae bacterium]
KNEQEGRISVLLIGFRRKRAPGIYGIASAV